jgi:hypothetical protein
VHLVAERTRKNLSDIYLQSQLKVFFIDVSDTEGNNINKKLSVAITGIYLKDF